MSMKAGDVLKDLEVGSQSEGGGLKIFSPVDGSLIGLVRENTEIEVRSAVAKAKAAFEVWRLVPPPRRGELIRLFGEVLREHQDQLGRLVTWECGKIYEEGRGEVREMIDICDFAVGLSRQLYGLTIASERPGHRMMETWHPLGPTAALTPFNFPVAVWCWNFAVALVCGNPVLWKPSEKTPLTALASLKLFEKAVERFKDAPPHLLQVLIGGSSLGEILVESPDIPLVSATGSTRMGRLVAPKVAARFGRCLLELGGNNGMILTPSADQDLALRAIAFSALGTAGQRCTSLRRLFVHASVYDKILPRLKQVYETVAIGNPLEKEVLMGPLIDKRAFEAMEAILSQAAEEGGTVHGGGRLLEDMYPDAFYVRPALVEMPAQTEAVKTETFAPILYVMRYEDFEDALRLHNAVPQGLSSCIFTNDIREAEVFLSARGSDCGIANVNIGPSGAEIGGAFGGEKETGGGRESGSDAWRAYMRRQTNTINFSKDLPLAQGIRFEVAQ